MPSLIVPINLQALCVGKPDLTSDNGTGTFAQIAADFSKMPYLADAGGTPTPVRPGPNYSEAVLPQPFTTSSDPLEQGVHLHWALPDALAHGMTSDDGSITLRTAPNRWLVTRIATNYADVAAPLTSMSAWIVESDALWDSTTADDPLATNALSRAIPITPLPAQDQVPNQPFVTLGRAFPYRTWVEGQGTAYAKPFTAAGYGELSFSAAYPHAPNVFGLYDDLSDLDLEAYPSATTRLSYSVSGWYSNPADDPFHQLAQKYTDPKALLAAAQDQLAWTFAEDASGSTPTQTICNGLLTNIKWDPSTAYVKQPSTASVQVAVGNSAAEAVSALLAREPGLPPPANVDQSGPATATDVEMMLNALQLGLLPRLSQPDGPMEMEEALHGAAFGSVKAGHIRVITPKTPANSQQPAGSGTTSDATPVKVTAADLMSAAGTLQQPLPQGLADDLNQLNILELRHHTLKQQIEAYRGQIFVDWYKYMNLQYPGKYAPNIGIGPADALDYTSQVIMTELDDLVNTALPAVSDQINQQVARINGELGDDYMLSSVAAPLYWQANDLVVLFSGEDFQPTYRPTDAGSYDSNGNLLCRLATNLIASLTVDNRTVTAAMLPQLPSSSNQFHVQDLQNLVAEAFFLDPNQSFVLAHAAENPPPADLWQRIRNAQQALFDTTGRDSSITFGGVAPAPLACLAWQQPWTPLLLQWEVFFYPLAPIDDGPNTPSAYASDFVTSTFTMDDDTIDLAHPLQISSSPPAVEIFQGTAPLSHNPEIGITAQIETFLANYPDSSYASELQSVLKSAGPPLMAQALGGFHQALVMRKQTLQLQISDPLAVASGSEMVYDFSNVDVPAAVGDQNRSAPLPNSTFNPIRAGFLKIGRLWVVDIFGQKREIAPDSGQVIRAASLVPRNDTAAAFLSLPPRITQPSRLLFRWLSADDDTVEMNSDPATTPVCGWVLFNHLDDSLMVYDALGNPLGSLNVHGPVWSGAPGSNATYDQPVGAAMSGVNRHLQAFVLGIVDHPNAVGFLQDLLAAIDTTVTLVNPQNADQYPAMSALIGRPLALVRASLALDLQGMPVLNQSWDAFVDAVTNTQATAARDTAAFERVSFPVRLGDLGKINDGLIGYFCDNGGPGAYQAFYAAAAGSGANGVAPPGPNQLLVSAGPDASPVLVTMLVDPRASVHATTGILPVKDIQIPPYMFSDALKHMAVTFLSTPVLSGTSQLALPVPKQDGYVWSWVSVDPGTKAWTSGPIAPVNLNGADFSTQQVYEGWLQLSEQASSPSSSNSD